MLSENSSKIYDTHDVSLFLKDIYCSPVKRTKDTNRSVEKDDYFLDFEETVKPYIEQSEVWLKESTVHNPAIFSMIASELTIAIKVLSENDKILRACNSREPDEINNNYILEAIEEADNLERLVDSLLTN